MRFIASVVFALMASPLVAQHAHMRDMKPEHVDPSVAASEPNPEYPLRLFILTAKRDQDKYGPHSYGSGNLLGDKPLGFDYKAPCKFLHSMNGDPGYQGKWKKQDKSVEILLQAPGQTHVEKCTLSVTMKSEAYSKDNPPPPLPTATEK